MRGVLWICGILALAPVAWSKEARAQESAPVLRAGVVGDTPPFVTAGSKGEPRGFSIDLFRAIAARMHRQIDFTVAPMSALAQDLTDNRLDLLPGPIPATPERSAEWLFTQGYVWSEYQFGTRPSVELGALDNLQGRRLAVEEGTDYAEWAARQSGKLGFTARTYGSLAAVFAAVRRREADASLTDSVTLAAAARGGGIVAALALPETRTQDGAAFRPTDAELRDAVEDALTCLKRSGDVARLAKLWLGREPGPEDLENLVGPGYGVPGLSGYDPKTHKISC